ncbi:MAG TPA: PIN domain-containing protein [Candidatus Nanoarchaeia archaeon]|nr:PIN domain-containing protein [Candidatus Nanoarchaeia archaeon]
MKLVVDANVLFALLIKQGKTKDVFFLKDLTLFAPKVIFEELAKYEEFLLEKTELSIEEFHKILRVFKRKVRIISSRKLSNFINLAREISPDKNDALYFAAALKKNCPIWTNDKKLTEQTMIRIYSTSDLIRIYNLQ